MKSSTLRRSNLSKERMLILEELSKNKQQPYDSSPGVYVHAAKEKELDILWQNFKVTQKEDKSPGIYLATGFAAGAAAMLIITTLLSFSVRGITSTDAPAAGKVKEKAKLTFIPADKTGEKADESFVNPELYTVKSGDTLESIIIRFYGKFDPAKLKKLKKLTKWLIQIASK